MQRLATGISVATNINKAYLGHYQNKSSSSIKNSDPLCLLENNKPEREFPHVFVIVGTKDMLLNDTAQLNKALETLALALPYQAKYYKNENHGFNFKNQQENAKQP